MKALILLISLIFSNYLSAETTTTHKWINPKGLIGKGNCFKVDTETLGKKYINKVKPIKCRPADISLLFNQDDGKCYEIDSKTGGLRYSKKIDIKECKTKNTSYINGIYANRYGCFQIDTPSNGKDYFLKVDNKNCQNIDADYRWKSISRYKGHCVVIIPGREPKKVANKKCRPNDVSYEFVRTGEKKGICYEMALDGAENYVQSTKIINCRNMETHFVFLKEENSLKGTCYEIDIETNGNKYLAKVKNEDCL